MTLAHIKLCLTKFFHSIQLRFIISSCLGSTRPDVSGPGEEVPITITMNEPKIQIIEVGNTVRFSCNAIPRFRSQVTISNWTEHGKKLFFCKFL